MTWVVAAGLIGAALQLPGAMASPTPAPTAGYLLVDLEDVALDDEDPRVVEGSTVNITLTGAGAEVIADCTTVDLFLSRSRTRLGGGEDLTVIFVGADGLLRSGAPSR